MPIIYLSPSTQEGNYYVNGGTEEEWMNRLADAMVPYLNSCGIRYTRNTPEMTAASSIRASNAGSYDLHLALHSNAAPEGRYGEERGIIAFYYPGSVGGQRAAELIAERATPDSPTMGLTTWKGAPDGKILKSDTLVAKNYLNEKELSRLNRLVTMFIDYAELMAEDQVPMSMEDWLQETDRFLTNNRRNVLEGKGRISREAAMKKVGAVYEEFRKKQDADYISDFDRAIEKYLKGGGST